MPRPRLARVLVLLLAGGLLLVGRVGAEPACPGLADGGVSLTIEPRADNALIFDATVVPVEAAAVSVEYGNERVGWLRSPTTGVGATQQVPLIRLRADTAYEVRAVALDAAGCPAGLARGVFATGPLPEGLTKLVMEANGPTSVPLTLVDFRLSDVRVKDDVRYFMVLDREWQPVWYYQIPREVTEEAAGMGANGLTRLANGNFLYLGREYGVEEITPDGRVARRVPLADSNIHHDLVQTADGRVLFLGVEQRVVDDTAVSGRADLKMRGDTLNRADLDSGTYEQLWNSFDSFDPAQRPREWNRFYRGIEDWTHANTVSLGPGGNVLLSFRHLDQVISFAPDLSTIQWRLGGPGSSFRFADESAFFRGQHTVTQLPNGHILMFDNGNYKADEPYSRALELELDFAIMTARTVWEYRHTPDVFSETQGSAYRLANGNTLINFGNRENPGEPVVLVEARPDGTAASVLTARVPGQRTTRYRAYPLETLGGELPIP